MERLEYSFFHRKCPEVARDLVGKVLVHNLDGEERRLRITETECYCGEEDTACHAHKGKTERTKTMYEEGGITYVYLCYGMHFMLNIVTGPKDHPEAVLIRGVEGANGPGRTTKLMQITTKDNGLSLTEEKGIWIEDDGLKFDRIALSRVGIDYASEEDRNRPWRYIIKERE